MNDSTPVLHRSKGRPKQKGTQNAPKGTYQKLLISQKVLDSVQRLSRDSVLSTDQLYSRFKLITADERTAEYYWRLVYTISFCQYRDLHARPQVSGTPQLCGERKYSVLQFSQDVDIAYFNLKRMFEGRGITKNFISYNTFLHMHGINFVAIQLDPGVIEKAYSYYSFIQDHTLDEKTLNKLFY